MGIIRQSIDATFPEGPFWVPVIDGDYDKLLEGIADADEDVLSDLQQLKYIRDPQKTQYLSDLEKEYGIITNTSLTEQTRRNALQSKMTEKNTGGRFEPLQNALTDSGFDLQVHVNDPPVDPAIFLDQSFQMVAGGDNAYAGRPDAFAARIGGELIVNGDIFTQVKAVEMQAGGAAAFAGNSLAVAGYFNELKRIPQDFDIPTDSGYWPLIFFIGGDATRDPVTDELTQIDIATIPADRRTELISLIVRLKPAHSWCGLVGTFV